MAVEVDGEEGLCSYFFPQGVPLSDVEECKGIDMKKSIYTSNNVILNKNRSGWWLSVKDRLTGCEQYYVIDQDEIQDLANVCVQALLEWEKPLKGMKEVKAKK